MTAASGTAAHAEAVELDRAVDRVRAGRSALVRVAAGGGTGLLVAAPFLEPELHFVAWVAFAPLLWAVWRAESAGEAALAGFAAGCVANFAGFYWLVHTIHVFGGFPLPVAAFFYLCLTAYSALQFALYGLGVRALGPGGWGIGPAVLWTALEFLYPNLFPWRIAHSQFPVPVLIQSGDVAGPYLLSATLVWAGAAAVALVAERRLGPLVACGALAASMALYGWVRIPEIEAAVAAAPALRVALVQGNVSIERKRDAAFFDVNVEQYRSLSDAVQAEVDLLIWPETVAQWWTPADARVLEPDQHPFPELRKYLVYGGLAYRWIDPQRVEAFNSAFLVGPMGELLGRYDKHILMPFGEYLPGARLFPALKRLSPGTGDFTAGTGIQTFRLSQVTLGPLICYEDVVAGIPRDMTRAGAQVLFNILNDAWFGDSAGPHEHQALALWRAVENRRYLLRASNSGVTSIIDPVGRVVSELGTFREGVLVGTVHPLDLLTLYTRHGDVFAWGVVAVASALLFRAKKWGLRRASGRVADRE